MCVGEGGGIPDMLCEKDAARMLLKRIWACILSHNH